MDFCKFGWLKNSYCLQFCLNVSRCVKAVSALDDTLPPPPELVEEDDEPNPRFRFRLVDSPPEAEPLVELLLPVACLLMKLDTSSANLSSCSP